jgi:chromosome segregation protein
MQLSEIKMAGFKSFVDPTTIYLPSKMIAVVGPNGCGKSNVIEAVMWVLGESSPKYLRGEAMTDVIFNGSNTRKPVGQASVELIFNNSDGSIGGGYAKFAQVSVKRVLTRDGASVYYINGVRCRKRDLVDLFLGTGLGPRSYAIIGQNMISKIIESKPDELRVYLEEAAGISKYKERKHETSLRIQHTKENMERVNDIRTELENQLNNLKHQANVAEKFKQLKQQERSLRAEYLGLQWRDLDAKMVNQTLKIQCEETALEARNSELTTIEKETGQLREEQTAAQDALQEVQQRYYAIGNEITRIEQDILHHQERKSQLENDLKTTDKDFDFVCEEITKGEKQFNLLQNEIKEIEPASIQLKNQIQDLQKKYLEAEEILQDWQHRWDEFNQLTAKTTQTVQVEKNHIQHLEQRILSLKKREEQLYKDQHQFDFDVLTKEIDSFTEQSISLDEKNQSTTQELTTVRARIEEIQHVQKNSQTKIDNLRGEFQRLQGQQSSFEALQQTALGQSDHQTISWLTKNNLHQSSRLAQHIEVEAGFELAVEKVLGSYLQAVCIEKINDIESYLSDFQSGNICFMAKHTEININNNINLNNKLLSSKIKMKSSFNLLPLLTNIYVVDTLIEAKELLSNLSDDASVITKEGIWLSQSWLKILKEKDPSVGVFAREQELKKISLKLNEIELNISELNEEIKQNQENLSQLKKSRDDLQQIHYQDQTQLTKINTQKKMQEQRLKELKLQYEKISREQTDCSNQLKEAHQELIKAKEIFEKAAMELSDQTKERDLLINEKEKSRTNVKDIKERFDEKKDNMRELEIRIKTAISQKEAIEQNILRLKNQHHSLSERKIHLQQELSLMTSMDSLKSLLSKTLDQHVTIETELTTARTAIDSLNQESRLLEEKRHIIDGEAKKIRQILETLRLEAQGWKVKSETLMEQIQETDFALEEILKNLNMETSIEQYQAKIDQISNRINRLGPINLMAIDEYAACQERKNYLDKQIEDLQAGLDTLDSAIAKIDKEIKTRFKETFDEVNNRFQELFPTVFEGGKAYLELTDENLLETGVALMATPPGKRNSSIYLLSGGEKSLTAIAFIFSIFHLNPAPFCMLDEVDAALDDSNVIRFTKLVQAMSDKTQFIFISHNKITIEMGQHLIGVTMNEPGVSRLVSVDIEKAISLAGVK